MRALTALAAVLIPAHAFAATLPVSGLYGTEGSCARTSDVDLLISPEGIGSLDLSCSPTKVRGSHVHLSCSLEGNTVALTATVTENKTAGTVTYIQGRNDPITLHRCK